MSVSHSFQNWLNVFSVFGAKLVSSYEFSAICLPVCPLVHSSGFFLELNHCCFDFLRYDNTPFIGTIEDKDDKGFKVNTLDNCGNSNYFKWTDDSVWYDEIIATINEPKPARVFLKLSTTDYAKFTDLFY
jgi:hypothetical protein